MKRYKLYLSRPYAATQIVEAEDEDEAVDNLDNRGLQWEPSGQIAIDEVEEISETVDE